MPTIAQATATVTSATDEFKNSGDYDAFASSMFEVFHAPHVNRRENVKKNSDQELLALYKVSEDACDLLVEESDYWTVSDLMGAMTDELYERGLID